MSDKVDNPLDLASFQQICEMNEALQKAYKAKARVLGDEIGFGNMMVLAAECWRDYMIEHGWPVGGEFSVGPCVALTVPCPCERRVSCDWCCGSGKVTKKVKAVMDALPKMRKSLAEASRFDHAGADAIKNIDNTLHELETPICPSCESRVIRVYSRDSTFGYGEGERTVELRAVVTVYECLLCRFEYTDGDAELERQKAVDEYLASLNGENNGP